MSIKIYNAFRLDTQDLLTLHKLMMKMRRIVGPLAEDKFLRIVAEHFINDFDDYVLHKTEKPSFGAVWERLWKRQKQITATKYRDPEVDFDFTINIIPVEDFVVGICFTEQSEWVDLWMKTSKAKDYSYWDNTDEDEDISKAEWRDRRRVWNKALGLNTTKPRTPSESGMTFDINLNETMRMPSLDEALTKIPSFESRINRIAKDRLFKQYTIREGITIDKKSSSDFVKAFYDFNDWLKSDEGKDSLTEETTTVSKFLPEIITRSHVVG